MEPDDALLTGIGGTRVQWREIPGGVRTAIERYLGQRVVRAASQAGGFSPAMASRLTLADGTGVFVKAIGPDRVSGAPGAQALYRREVQVAGALPDTVAAPRLLASMETDEWIVLIFEEIQGAPPSVPWQPADLRRVLASMTDLAHALTPSPIEAPPASVPGGQNGWIELGGNPGLLSELPGLSSWTGANIDRLAELTSVADEAHRGSTLLHSDIRADNMLLTDDRVVFVDWPHARIGAAWVDLVYFLPSVAMQGRGDLDALFAAHPLAADADPEAVRSVLASVAGYFIHHATMPAPPGLPLIRRFQLVQGIHALTWLEQMLG